MSEVGEIRLVTAEISSQQELEAAATRIPTEEITAVYVDGVFATDRWLGELFSALPDTCQSITVINCPISGTIWQHWTRLPSQLTTLDFTGCTAIDDLWASELASRLTPCTALQDLTLAHNQMGDVGARRLLRQVPSLTALDFSRTCVRGEELTQVERLSHLQSLSLSGCGDLIDTGCLEFLWLMGASRVESLDLSELPQLQPTVLTLSSPHLATALRRLDLHNSVLMSDEAVASFVELRTGLEALDVRGCPLIGDQLRAALGQLTRLNELKMEEKHG